MVAVPVGLGLLLAALVQAARRKEAAHFLAVGWLAFSLVIIGRLIAFNYMIGTGAGAGQAAQSMVFLNVAQGLRVLSAPLIVSVAVVAISIARDQCRIRSNPRLAFLVLLIMFLAIVMLFESSVVRGYHQVFDLP